MYSDHPHQHGDMPDSLDDFLAQFLGDITAPLPPPPPPPSTSVAVPDPTIYHSPSSQLICQWVLMRDVPLTCGASLLPDPKHVCAHFRQAHEIRGNEKAIVNCYWRGCQVPPMQRGSLIRHVSSVHLGLLKWRCEVCGKVFSRKGTGHACTDAEDHDG